MPHSETTNLYVCVHFCGGGTLPGHAAAISAAVLTQLLIERPEAPCWVEMFETFLTFRLLTLSPGERRPEFGFRSS